MFVLMISMSDLKLGHLGSKTRSLGQTKENLVNTRDHISEAIIMNLAQNLVCMISRSSSKLGHLES